jgi:ribose transport system ATP-binding protein
MQEDRAPEAVRIIGVSKSFGGVRALDDVSFDVARGEIHALLGENGAGKSTVLKILSGVQPLDSGRIEIAGEQLDIGSTDAARRAGIAMIFQEMSLIPTLTVAQNVFLTRECKGSLGLIDDQEAVRRAATLFEQFEVELDVRGPVDELGAGQRQLTEIVKAISQTARILILDEPTSALSATEVEKLFTFLRRIRSEGVAIIYVSHRMDEIMRIADKATILRDGRHVATAPIGELSLEKIIEYMVGRRAGFSDLAQDSAATGEVYLELSHVAGRHRPVDVNLKVRRGEVIGIAGLLGSGRSSLARVLCGIEPLVGGQIRIAGKTVEIGNPQDALGHGIAMIPEDRIRQGLIAQHSIADNICLSVLDRLRRWVFILKGKSAALVSDQIAHLRIKTESPASAVNTLSGGNQQKVVLAKWLAAEPQILVLDEPTAGVDIGSKTEIVTLIRDLARRGKTVLLISSELPELLTASDRVVVMSEGRTVRDIARSEIFVPEESGRDPVERLNGAERRLQVALQGALGNA